jgi:MFS family permease
MFVIGLAVFTAASALCALSPNTGLLITSRTAQGIGGGIAVPLALALITDTTPPQQRGKALGIWVALTGVAVAAGPLVGGAIVEGLAWQWIFWLNVPVGITIAVLATRKINRDLRPRGGKIDPIGLALATLGVFAIAQALIRGNAAGWSSLLILGGLIGGGKQADTDAEWAVVQGQLKVLGGEEAEGEHAGHEGEAGDTACGEATVDEQGHGHHRVCGASFPDDEQHQDDDATDEATEDEQ